VVGGGGGNQEFSQSSELISIFGLVAQFSAARCEICNVSRVDMFVRGVRLRGTNATLQLKRTV
jgi:hypothetical protein